MEEKKIRWHHTGHSTHRLRRINGKMDIIKPQQKFDAYPSEVPEAFRDIIKPVEDLPVEPPLKGRTEFEKKKVPDNELTDEQKKALDDLENPPTPETQADAKTTDQAPGTDADANTASNENPENEHEIVVQSAGWYNVINTVTGKILNEKALRLHEADELLRSLNE